jgi:hypothetical protein
MAYVDPPNFVSATTATAADANILSEDIRFLKGITDGVGFSGAQVSRTSAQSIADATDTDITFQAEAWDYGGWWTSGTDVIVPAGAVPAGYTSIATMFVARLRFVTEAAGGRIIKVNVNGSTVGMASVPGLSGDQTDVSVTCFAVVEAADVITLVARQNSGGALNCDVANLTVVRYSPAA